jgi:glycosyltransferase involved in cell wall biosynthesis
MKILFYSHTGQVSGAENILLLALKRLNKNRFKALAVCPAGDLAGKISKLDIPVSLVQQLEARFTWRIDRIFKYAFSLVGTVKQLRSEITKAQPDAIHGNSIRAGLTATMASFGMKIPVFWHIQDELKPHPFSTIIRLLAAASPKTRLIAASQATADSFRGRLLCKIGKHIPVRIVHNAIEFEKFEFNPANRPKIREELQISDSELVLGIVGQITPRKGQLELIRTFAKTRGQMPSSTLLLVGEPMFNKDHVYLEELKQTVADLGLENCIKFLGLRKDVAAIMQSLDVLVVNSKSEALVVVAIEAMACGTPVIATAVGGTKEMIEHKTNGWLVPFGNEEKLTEALIAFSRQPKMCAAFAENGKEVVASLLNAEKFIKNIEDFFIPSLPDTEMTGELLTAKH